MLTINEAAVSRVYTVFVKFISTFIMMLVFSLLINKFCK